MAIWGWMSEPELLWLGEQAARMGSVAEIGCLHGRSAFMILTRCPGPVYCVDPWNDEADHSFPSFMGSCGHFPNVRPVRAYSPLPDTPDVEMCFIDGSHAYGSVLADIAGWLPHTSRLICGHDYQNVDAGFPGVQSAVNQVFGDRVRVAPETSIWYVDLEADRSVEPNLPTGPYEFEDEYMRVTTANLKWDA